MDGPFHAINNTHACRCLPDATGQKFTTKWQLWPKSRSDGFFYSAPAIDILIGSMDHRGTESFTLNGTVATATGLFAAQHAIKHLNRVAEQGNQNGQLGGWFQTQMAFT